MSVADTFFYINVFHLPEVLPNFGRLLLQDTYIHARAFRDLYVLLITKVKVPPITGHEGPEGE